MGNQRRFLRSANPASAQAARSMPALKNSTGAVGSPVAGGFVLGAALKIAWMV